VGSGGAIGGPCWVNSLEVLDAAGVLLNEVAQLSHFLAVGLPLLLLLLLLL
jgi:hypothetical protein